MREKKIWGRKRHMLVDTQGNLLAVTVTGAQRSDQEGGRMMLSPLKEKFPKMQLLWGDSHYGGTMITWLKIHLGWTMRDPCVPSPYPSAASWYPKAPMWTGNSFFRLDSVPCPEDGWWSVASPG